MSHFKRKSFYHDRDDRGGQSDQSGRGGRGGRSGRGGRGGRSGRSGRGDKGDGSERDRIIARGGNNHKRFNQNNSRFRGNNNYRNNNRYNNYNGDLEKNEFINQEFIKQQLVNYIYNALEISKFKYSLIEYEYDLPLITNTKHFVSPNYNGIVSLLVFKKIQDKYYSVIIDRRTLSYNPTQLDINKVKITPINVQLDESIYNGSIIDGVLLYNNGHNRKKIFVVNDLYFFRGKKLTDDKINNKMLNISVYLDSFDNKDSNLNTVELIPNKLYDLKDIKKLVNVHIPKSKYSNCIKGVTFYPEISGTKLIYL